MLSFFYRYRYRYNPYKYECKLVPYLHNQNLYTYNTNLQKYIRKIESELREKKLLNPLNTDIILHKPMYTGYNLMPIVGFICLLAGYNLSKFYTVL